MTEKIRRILTVWDESKFPFENYGYTLWKNQKLTLTEFFFRLINYLVISLVNTLVSRNFCQNTVRVNFSNFHTAHCGNYRNFLSPKPISSNQLFSDFFSKIVTFTKFLPKMSERKFP